MNVASSLLAWFYWNYVSKECLSQQIPAQAEPPWVLIHRLFNCGFSPHRVAIKLWKPCSEAKNSHPEGGEWGGGGPPLMALAGVHAGTAVCSYVPEMKEKSAHLDQMYFSLQVSMLSLTLYLHNCGGSLNQRVDPDCGAMFYGVRCKT